MIGEARGTRPAILPRVPEIRHHSRDPGPRRARRSASTITSNSIRLSLGRRRGRLHEEDIASAHVLHQLDPAFAVTEAADLGVAELRLQMSRDILRERGIRITGKQGQGIARSHVIRFD